MGTSDSKILIIDIVSQNKLNTFKKHENWLKFWKIAFRVLRVSPEHYPTIKSKIGLVVEKLFKFNLLMVLGPRVSLIGPSEGKILTIDTLSQNIPDTIKKSWNLT